MIEFLLQIVLCLGFVFCGYLLGIIHMMKLITEALPDEFGEQNEDK